MNNVPDGRPQPIGSNDQIIMADFHLIVVIGLT